VKWEDGAPCVGLPLVAERYKPGLTPIGDWRNLSPADRIARYEEAAAWFEASSLRAVTDAEGRFEFTGLPDGSVGILSDDRERRLSPPRKLAKPGDELELVVRRSHLVQFTFTLDNGEVLTAAKVMLSGDEHASQVPTAWTPASEYRVAAGACKVTVTGGPHELWSATHDFEVPREGLNGPVAVTLQGKDALIVRRINEEPYYLNPGIFVLPADSVPADTGVDFYPLAMRLDRYGGGRFPNPYVVPDLAPGDYTIICALGHMEILQRRNVRYDGGRVEVELQMPPVRVEDNIIVRVFGPDGAIIRSPSLSLRTTTGSSGTYYGVIQHPGETWLRRIPAEVLEKRSVTGARYQINVHTTLGAKVVECPLDQRDPVEIRFGKRARLIVHLDNLPADRAGLTIHASTRGHDWNAFTSGGFPHTGPAVLQSRHEATLASGPAVVAIKYQPTGEYSYDSFAVYRRELDLREGDNEIRIDLTQIAPLHVRVPDELKEWRLTLHAPGVSIVAEVSKGRALFKYIGPGDYTLEGDGGVMAVTLPAAGEVVFAPLPYNALCVTRLDTTGVYEEIGLNVGDLVRSINGQALSGSSTALYAMFNNADADMTLGVQRDGRTVIVTATATQWKKCQGHRTDARRVAD
jgi:hypothetical protein